MMRWSEIRSLGPGSKHAISSHNFKNLHVLKRAQDSTCGAYFCANISWSNHQQIQPKLCQSLCLMHLNISLLPLPGSESFSNSLICDRSNVNSDNLSFVLKFPKLRDLKESSHKIVFDQWISHRSGHGITYRIIS